MHADVSTKEVKFSVDNSTVYENFLADGMISYVPVYKRILDSRIPVLLYVGNMDRRDGPFGVMEWMKKLKWRNMTDFYASSRYTYHYKSDETGEIMLGGNYKQYGYLNLLMVYNAGHLVPSTQLALTRQMLKDMVESQKLKCHKADLKCSLDSISCEYLNNCSGNGQCVNGK